MACSSVAGTSADGQDGQVVQPTSYSHPTADTTLDLVTGLQWTRDTVTLADGGSLFNFDGANQVCLELDAGAYHDWRAPRTEELLSIDDLGKHPHTYDTVWFDESGADTQWTSDLSPFSGQAVRVNFYNGEVVSEVSTGLHAVRCVRGGPCGPPTRFDPTTEALTGSGNWASGVVFDEETGLYWAKAWMTGQTWTQALSECRTATGTLHASGWRLATAHELATLLAPDGGSPALDSTVFSNGASDAWSSSPVVQDPTEAWFVAFSSGAVYRKATTSTLTAPCVHDRP